MVITWFAVPVTLVTTPERPDPLPVVASSVPLVGKVTFVAPVLVSVTGLAPEVAKLPPIVMVFPALFTPAPPLAPGRMAVTFVVRSTAPDARAAPFTEPLTKEVLSVPAVFWMTPVSAGKFAACIVPVPSVA